MDFRRFFGFVLLLPAAILAQAQVATELPRQQLEVGPLTLEDDQSRLGNAVAVSGRTALISAPGRQRVLEFVQDRNGIWRRGTTFTPPAGPDGTFGGSLALQGDIALISAAGKQTVYFYVRRNGRWQLRQAITPREPAPGFGSGVALSGWTVAIGSNDVGGAIFFPAGSVRIFDLWFGRWLETGRVASRTGTADAFGASLALHFTQLIVGAPTFNGQGAAVVFERRGLHRWVERQTLIAADGTPNDDFGVDVAIRHDVAVVGAQFADGIPFEFQDGSAYVFTRSGRNWVETQKIRPDTSDPSVFFTAFGRVVRMTRGRLAISAPETVQGTDSGRVWVYERRGQQYEVIAQLEDDRSFGTSLDLTPRTLVVGQPFFFASTPDAMLILPGTAWAYDLPQPQVAAVAGEDDEASE